MGWFNKLLNAVKILLSIPASLFDSDESWQERESNYLWSQDITDFRDEAEDNSPFYENEPYEPYDTDEYAYGAYDSYEYDY